MHGRRPKAQVDAERWMVDCERGTSPARLLTPQVAPRFQYEEQAATESGDGLSARDEASQTALQKTGSRKQTNNGIKSHD